MLKIAKVNTFPDYETTIDVEHVSKHSSGTFKEYQVLKIEIINDSYSLNFTIDKDIKEILNIKKYEKMTLNNNNLLEAFFNCTGKNETAFFKIYEMDINMFNDALGISFEFNSEDEYYGNIDIEIELDKIKELVTEK